MPIADRPWVVGSYVNPDGVIGPCVSRRYLFPMENPTTGCDVAIIGAGPYGLSAGPHSNSDVRRRIRVSVLHTPLTRPGLIPSLEI